MSFIYDLLKYNSTVNMIVNKKYKIVKLTQIKNDISNLEVLIAELVEGVKQYELKGRVYYAFNNNSSEYFVFLRESSIANYIIDNIDEIITLKICDFVEDNILFEDPDKTRAYFHEDYIAVKNEIQLIENVELDTELKNEIHEFILYYNVDMLFYSIFDFIRRQEYEFIDESTSLNSIFEKFTKVSAALIGSLCELKTRYYTSLTSSDVLLFNEEYSQIMEHIAPLKNEVVVYVSFREKLQKKILKAFSEGHGKRGSDLSNFPVFFTHSIYIAYDIAINRFKENISNKSLLGHEIVQTDNSIVIKLFPTPLGCYKLAYLIDLANTGRIDDYIDDYFRPHGILRIKDEALKKQLNTRFIFSMKSNNQIFYYKRRHKDDNYTPYAELNRKNPLVALLNQLQMNLFRLK